MSHELHMKLKRERRKELRREKLKVTTCTLPTSNQTLMKNIDYFPLLKHTQQQVRTFLVPVLITSVMDYIINLSTMAYWSLDVMQTDQDTYATSDQNV